jgi:hypothetical protein
MTESKIKSDTKSEIKNKNNPDERLVDLFLQTVVTMRAALNAPNDVDLRQRLLYNASRLVSYADEVAEHIRAFPQYNDNILLLSSQEEADDNTNNSNSLFFPTYAMKELKQAFDNSVRARNPAVKFTTRQHKQPVNDLVMESCNYYSR